MDTESNQPAPQAAEELPLDERIARMMGSEDYPDREAEAEPAPEQPEETEAEQVEAKPDTPAEEFFEFEADGKKYQLPKAIEDSILKAKDYTQKTQKLAEERRNIEMLQQQATIARIEQTFREAVAEEVQQVAMIDAEIKQLSQMDWANMDTDALVRAQAKIAQYKMLRDEIAGKIDAKRADHEQKVVQSFSDLKAKATERVKQIIPNWSEEVAKAVKAHALADGYTEAELSNIFDPRHVATLHKAWQYDQLQAKAKAAVVEAKAVKTTPSNPMPKAVKDRLAFKKAVATAKPGSQQYKAALNSRIESIFGG